MRREAADAADAIHDRSHICGGGVLHEFAWPFPSTPTPPPNPLPPSHGAVLEMPLACKVGAAGKATARVFSQDGDANGSIGQARQRQVLAM